LDALGQREITSLLVEGGRTVHESFIREALVNQFEVYLAPKLIADLSQKQAVCIDSFESLGSDYLILATPDQKEPL